MIMSGVIVSGARGWFPAGPTRDSVGAHAAASDVPSLRAANSREMEWPVRVKYVATPESTADAEAATNRRAAE
jgi:hypothetical protein